MEYFTEYRILERKKDLSSFLDYYYENGIDIFIIAVKHTGITINPYPGNSRYERLVQDITGCIHDKQDQFKWQNMLQESAILNNLYNDLYSSENYIIANSVDEESSISAFLIAFEYRLRSIAQLMKGGYNFDDEGKYNPDSFAGSKELIEIYDWVSQTASNILAYLLFFKNKAKRLKTNISEEVVAKSLMHFHCVDRKELLDDITKEWQFNGRSIVKNEAGNVSAIYTGKIILDYYISKLRAQHRKETFYMGFAWSDYVLGKNDNHLDDIDAGFHEVDEVTLAEEYLKFYFNADAIDDSLKTHIDETNEDIIIKDYLLVYSQLIQMAKEFLNNKQDVKSLSLNNTCMEVNLETFKYRVLNLGVSEASLKTILPKLVFNKDWDCYDCPLIKIQDSYYVVPTLVANVEISQVLLSRFRKYDFRGEFLERAVIDLLRDNGITASGCEYRENEEIYQCDVMFAIERDVFICECKSWGEDYNIRGYYDQYEKRIDAKQQLDRIANKLTEVKSTILETLGIKSIRNIVKVVILNNAIGAITQIEDTYFTDFSCLSMFVQRESPDLRFLYKDTMYRAANTNYYEYSGRITYNKIMRFLNSPKPVEIMGNNVTTFNKNVIIGTINVEIEQYRQRISFSGSDKDINDNYFAELQSILEPQRRK